MATTRKCGGVGAGVVVMSPGGGNAIRVGLPCTPGEVNGVATRWHERWRLFCALFRWLRGAPFRPGVWPWRCVSFLHFPLLGLQV